ncbi:MAG: hypothetical protein ACOCVL_00895 [Candidatus Sumerlaeota bacterium]
MAEDLQHLLDTIKKDGIDKAQVEADSIVKEAREKAAQIVEEAREEAQSIREEAEKDADQSAERGKRALKQAARDVIISVERGVEKVLERTVNRTVEEALTPDQVKEILSRAIEGYMREACSGGRCDLFLSQDDEKALAKFFSAKLHELAQSGITLHTDTRISSGFRLSIKEEHVYFDFSGQAVAEELNRHLQPSLREVVMEIIKEDQQEEKSE